MCFRSFFRTLAVNSVSEFLDGRFVCFGFCCCFLFSHHYRLCALCKVNFALFSRNLLGRRQKWSPSRRSRSHLPCLPPFYRARRPPLLPSGTPPHHQQQQHLQHPPHQQRHSITVLLVWLFPLETICSATQCTAQQLCAQLSSAAELTRLSNQVFSSHRLPLSCAFQFRVLDRAERPYRGRAGEQLFKETEILCTGKRALECERKCKRRDGVERKWNSGRTVLEICVTERWQDMTDAMNRLKREEALDRWYQGVEFLERCHKSEGSTARRSTTRDAVIPVLVSVKPWRSETEGLEVSDLKRRRGVQTKGAK